VSLIPAVMAVILLAVAAREVAPPAADGASPSALRPSLERRFHYYLAVVVVFTLGNSSDAFLILRARSVGLSVTGILAMMLVFNLVYALLAGPAGALSDRIGRRRLLAAGWGVYALVYLGFAWMNAPWHAWVLMAVYGVYYALTEGVGRAFVADLVRPEAHGTAFGAYHAAIGLAALPASLMAGILWQGVGAWPGFGPAAPFLVGGVLALVAILLLTRVPQPST
jgi:MFS family permease